MPLNNHWRNIPLKYGYDVEGSDDDHSDTFTHRKERHVISIGGRGRGLQGWTHKHSSGKETHGEGTQALTKHLESLHGSSQHSEDESGESVHERLLRSGHKKVAPNKYFHPSGHSIEVHGDGSITHRVGSGTRHAGYPGSAISTHAYLDKHERHLRETTQHSEEAMDAQHEQATRFFTGVHKEHAKNLYSAGWRITRGNKWGHEKYGEHEFEDAQTLHHIQSKSSQHSEEGSPEFVRYDDSRINHLTPKEHRHPLHKAIDSGEYVGAHWRHKNGGQGITGYARKDVVSKGVTSQGHKVIAHSKPHEDHISEAEFNKRHDASQHSEEETTVEPGHVTPERARELVAQTPGGHIVRRY